MNAPVGSELEAATVRQALQSATAPAHSRLHGNAAFAALLKGELGEPDYARLLLRLYGLHAPIERRMAVFADAPALAWWRAPAAASRASLIHRDLAALGLDDGAIRAAPQADTWLGCISDAITALGCAWVVEGSSLGGRLMARAIERRLGGGHRTATAFFTSHPAQPERWRQCCEAVERYQGDAACIQAMATAAAQTFAAFEQWLDPAAWA